MAAQDRSKQTQTKEAPIDPPSFDVVTGPPPPQPPPDFDQIQLAPPPLPATNLAPPPLPPPSFDFMAPPAPLPMPTPPPPAFDDFMSAPTVPATAPQWNVSAPRMDDLMDSSSLAQMEPVAPPRRQEESLEDIIGAIDGLTEEEKRTLLAEQANIMANIEQSKPSASSSTHSMGKSDEHNLRLVGTEKTMSAIADGTAVVVQCLSCQNLLQVTQAAKLMFCPFCQVVCPVQEIEDGDGDQGVVSDEMPSDLELAKKLQQEEYGQEDTNDRLAAQQKAREKKAKKQSQSWGEWLGLKKGSSSRKVDEPQTVDPPSSSFSQPRGGLISAVTGEESFGGYASQEEDSAQMTESSSMFARDSGSNEESSMLAVPQISRKTDDS